MSERINVYRCPRGHNTVTVDRHQGVTSFMLRCRARGCTEMAESSFYRVHDPKPTPTHEWYAPSPAEIQAMPKEYRNHYEQGGLAIRKIRGIA